MKHSKVAYRYAKSLFELAQERDALAGAQDDMEMLASTISENPDLSVLLRSPIVHADKKLSILNSIFGGSMGEVSMKFVTIITQKGRESLLEAIATAFVVMAKEKNNIFAASVQTPAPLSDASRAKIGEIVQQIQPGSIELDEQINKDLIGGFILKVGDKMIDSSVSSHLLALRREFTENPYEAEI
ncbi:MAG: F-type H+-transporting ATPase subunit delta [Flavobacteriales bacterium]|jgi:F-type H+-transporting ATPase subunit delta